MTRSEIIETNPSVIIESFQTTKLFSDPYQLRHNQNSSTFRYGIKIYKTNNQPKEANIRYVSPHKKRSQKIKVVKENYPRKKRKAVQNQPFLSILFHSTHKNKENRTGFRPGYCQTGDTKQQSTSNSFSETGEELYQVDVRIQIHLLA